MRKLPFLLILFLCICGLYGEEKVSNLIIIPSSQNLNSGETEWLLDSVKDKLESNLQTYTNYSLISSSDKKIKELQKKSESAGYDEDTAIELGKLVSASHAIFLTVRKAGQSYTITTEFTNLSTGKLLAKSMSSGKTRADSLFNSNGSAVDEVTIDLCEKLGISLSNVQKYILKNGSESLSEVDQLSIFNQEIANLDNLTKSYDEQIAKLMQSNDLDVLTKKNKLESEKALTEQKKKTAEANKKRLSELEKARKEEAIVNEGRTVELQNKILEVSKKVNEKTAELRKLTTENLSAFGKIRVLEAKKAALVDIRDNVRKEQNAIPEQYEKEYKEKIDAINNAPLRTAEKNSDGTVSEEAKTAREQKVKTLIKQKVDAVLEAQKQIAKSTYDSQVEIMMEIMADQDFLSESSFYANTLNNSLIVKIGNYGNEVKGWRVDYSVVCEGIILTSGKGIIKYDDLERMMPSGMDRFDAIDMYDSLFKCGEPVLVFAIDYRVEDSEKKISTYDYNFGSLKAINTAKAKVEKSGDIKGDFINCSKESSETKQMYPLNNWMEIVPCIAENNSLDDFDYVFSVAQMQYEKQKRTTELKKNIQNIEQIFPTIKGKKTDETVLYLLSRMVPIPGKNYFMLDTEMTQEIYEYVMGSNPSCFKGDYNPVEKVSWYDAIYFCNKLSIQLGLVPVYSVNGQTDVNKWRYIPHKGNSINGKVTQKLTANGFRLPIEEEWEHAARGGQNFTYSGSDNLDEVGWYYGNSRNKTHPVAKKKANGYGLYDMSGNVCEWCWDVNQNYSDYRYCRGGCYFSFVINC